MEKEHVADISLSASSGSSSSSSPCLWFSPSQNRSSEEKIKKKWRLCKLCKNTRRSNGGDDRLSKLALQPRWPTSNQFGKTRQIGKEVAENGCCEA
ncbi:hypothetical protein Q3G72_008868 [Acer saccharum]|nr:hypothetical protein Q3G72_008868 [Acer saccharum]